MREAMLIVYLGIVVTWFSWWAMVWASERSKMHREQANEERLAALADPRPQSLIPVQIIDPGFSPRILRESAWLALVAPIWPLVMLWALGRETGIMIGHLMLDVRRHDR